MSWRSPKPDSSVAGVASHGDVGVGHADAREHVGQALPGDRGGALADDQDPPDGAARPARRRSAGRQRRLAEVGAAAAPSSLDDAAPQRLAERAGASLISFSRKCGDVATVDVARRDLGRDQLVVGRPGSSVPS